MFLTILLQAAVTGINTDTLINSLMSQGPCVALLIIAVVYLNKRNTKQSTDIQTLNDKVEKYMVEDHERMIGVIENNTKVIQNFLNSKK
jgi:hypothetical protein